ncbi:MAG: hypothetical protein H8E09_00240 [Gammaproteobacteria bacterium]|nr:hypothetical protein [Gammaproteobacteria bacterium]
MNTKSTSSRKQLTLDQSQLASLTKRKDIPADVRVFLGSIAQFARQCVQAL